jgi:hypothetical protein
MLQNAQARAIIAGPIEDAGQLLLAMVINTLAGEDGWVYKTGLELGKLARMGKTAVYEKLAELEKMGLVERQMGPPHAVRLDRQAVLGDRETVIGDRQANSGGDRETVFGDRQAVSGDRQANSPSPSAYLPLKDKDLKEKEKEKEKEKKITASPSSSSSSDLVLVASNQTPKSPRLDQPAAQPPAVAKPKRKTPTRNPKTRIPADWQPDARTLEICLGYGVSEEHCWQQLPEFVLHHEERGEARPGWRKSFVYWMKNQVKWKKENEQKSEQARKYTDAAGRPISERDYVARQLTKRVVADMENGTLDGIALEDLKF